MNVKKAMSIAVGLAVCLALPAASLAQLPAAAALVPAGFKVETERAIGPTTIIEATKPNDNFPKPHQDNGIRLSISSNGMPGSARTVDILASQPEDPARQLPGSVSREEPCGKKRYRGGVLTCRKVITPWVGAGSGPDLVVLNLSWVGATPASRMAVSVSGFCGTNEAAVALLDSVISKLIPAEQ